MKRALLLALASLPTGCNLLLDIGEHHLQSDADGNATSTSVGAGGEAGDGGGGEGGSGGDGSGGGAPPCLLGGKPEVLVSGQRHPTVIRADGTHVFWINEASDGSAGAVMKASDDVVGGTATPLVEDLSKPVGLGLGFMEQFNSIYFTENGGNRAGLYTVLKSGAAPPTLIASHGGFDAGALLTTNDREAFAAAWSKREGSRMQMTALDGMTDLGRCFPYAAGAPAGRIDAMAAGNEYVYFAGPVGANVLRVGRDCVPEPGEVFAENPDGTSTRAIVLNNNTGVVFWLTATQLLKKEKMAPPEEKPMVLASEQAGPRDLKIHSTFVYFTNSDDGTVMQSDPISGGLCVVTAGQGRPSGLAVNDDTLFWTNYDSGEIVRYVLP